jgi:hypothetical protein
VCAGHLLSVVFIIMLPSRSSTPRPRPVASNSSSLIGYQEGYASAPESSWSTPGPQLTISLNYSKQLTLARAVKGRGKDESYAEPSLDVRPRKRRRVASGSMAPAENRAARSLTPLKTSYSAQHNLDSAPNMETRPSGLCQTCQRCESSLFCAR